MTCQHFTILTLLWVLVQATPFRLAQSNLSKFKTHRVLTLPLYYISFILSWLLKFLSSDFMPKRFVHFKICFDNDLCCICRSSSSQYCLAKLLDIPCHMPTGLTLSFFKETTSNPGQEVFPLYLPNRLSQSRKTSDRDRLLKFSEHVFRLIGTGYIRVLNLVYPTS